MKPINIVLTVLLIPDRHAFYHYVSDPACGYYENCKYDVDWLHAMANDETRYKLLLAKGWKPQDARSVFPNGLASRIVITMNLRMWRHFFLMRTSAQAHPLLKWVDAPLLAEFKQAIPVLYDDIEAGETQIVNLRKGR
jgi:thymidylate synthase ThyX